MKNTNLVEIPTADISPHPENPRKDLGDLTELVDSIRTNGILQNLTVVRNDSCGYTVIIGHRRLAAAKLAGLETVPCAVVEMSEDDQLATMLAENMQRSDLTVYEQAEGIQLLLDRSFSIADIAEKTGFSESTIRRRTKLLELDKDAFKRSQQRQVSLADYEKLNEIEDIDSRNRLLDALGTNNFNNEFEKAKRNQKEKIRRQTLIHYLESLPNARPAKKKRASIWAYVATVFNEKEALKHLKSDREYCYEVNTYSVCLFRKRTEAELERDQHEEERREARERFSQEGQIINETMRNLRKEFIEDPPKLTKEQYLILVKEFLRTRINGSCCYGTPDCLYGSKSNFDDVFDSDNGVKIMLELIGKTLDIPNRYYQYISNSLEKPWNISENLNTLYYLLTRLGYQMSDEEIQLRDGTHPIYTKYKNYREGESHNGTENRS